jgi:hypothetical protein
LLPWATRPLTEYGRPEQRGGLDHVAGGQGLAHHGAGHAQPVHLVAHHPGHVEAERAAGGVQHRVVAGAPRAEAEIVAHQHVAHAQSRHQHVGDEALGRQGREVLVEAQQDHVVDAATLQLEHLVAQRGDARRGEFGLAGAAREEVARVRLEGEHAGRHAAMARLVAQQRQHGLVAAVHAVEVADGQRRAAFREGEGGEGAEAAMDLHGGDYRPRSRRASSPWGWRDGLACWIRSCIETTNMICHLEV